MMRPLDPAQRSFDEMDIHGNNKVIQRLLAERAAASSSGIVLMLDRFLGTGVDIAAFEMRGCHSAEVRLRHPAFVDTDRTPLLLRIRPEDSDLIGLAIDVGMLEQADPQQEAVAGLTVAGWMETDASLGMLAKHLAAVMEQRVNGSGQVRVLRLSDRRVLEFVWDLLRPAQRVALLGPITTWHVIDRCGVVRELGRLPEVQSNGMLREGLRLEDGQWLQLEQCQQIQEMARGWKSIVQVLPPDYLRQLRAALAAARDVGLSANHDVQLLAAYILQIHPMLASHDRVVELVNFSIRTKSPLMDAFAEIPDPEGWEQIKRELDSVWLLQRSFDAAHT